MAEQASTVTPSPTEWANTLDADTKTWVGGMGLDKLPADQALGKLLPMYRGAEQKLGIPADQLLRLPGKDAKPEDWKPIWSKLGTPENPEGYEIKPPEGQDGAFLKQAVGWFHELGIPKQMAQGLATKWNEHVQALQVQNDGQWNARFEKELGELKQEWGQDYDRNTDLSKRVQRAFGLGADELQSIERALGPKKFLQSFAKFGSSVGEHRFVGQGNQSFSMSPEGAKERIKALQDDQAWQKGYLAGDADKKAEWTRLHGIAYPEQMAA